MWLLKHPARELTRLLYRHASERWHPALPACDDPPKRDPSLRWGDANGGGKGAPGVAAETGCRDLTRLLLCRHASESWHPALTDCGEPPKRDPSFRWGDANGGGKGARGVTVETGCRDLTRLPLCRHASESWHPALPACDDRPKRNPSFRWGDANGGGKGARGVAVETGCRDLTRLLLCRHASESWHPALPACDDPPKRDPSFRWGDANGVGKAGPLLRWRKIRRWRDDDRGAGWLGQDHWSHLLRFAGGR